MYAHERERNTTTSTIKISSFHVPNVCDFFPLRYFFHSILPNTNIHVRTRIRTKNIPFLQMFVGSCAHININTSANAPHYKSTGTFCLVAFLYNYKAAHCDKKIVFRFVCPIRTPYTCLLCFASLCFAVHGELASVERICGTGLGQKYGLFVASFNFCRFRDRSVRHGTIHSTVADTYYAHFLYPSSARKVAIGYSAHWQHNVAAMSAV